MGFHSAGRSWWQITDSECVRNFLTGTPYDHYFYSEECTASTTTPTTTSSTRDPLEPTLSTTTLSTTTTLYACMEGNNGFHGPMLGIKYDSSDAIGAFVGKSASECAELCSSNARCKEFGNGFRGSLIESKGRTTKCLLY